MLLGPVADQGQVGPECVLDDVVEVADEHGAVTQSREAGDVLDHLGVVVGSQERLVVAAVRHRQPADEVREPDVRRALQLRVLVQVVVELPRLVADPEVVLLIPHQVVEDHEVCEQDLVHAADRLEAVQVVLRRLALDVARLVREVGAGGMDPLAPRLQHRRHGMLREPVDLEVGVELAQLVGDRRVALRVPEPDRRGDVERTLPTRLAAHPAARRRGRLDEVPQEQIDLHGIARVRQVAGALDRHEGPARSLRERCSLLVRTDQIAVSMDDERRIADAGAGFPEALETAQRERTTRVRERLRVRLQPPSDCILDLLRRVGFGKALREEELEELAVASRPEVAVVLRPALLGVVCLVERVDLSLGMTGGEADRGRDVDDAVHALRVVGREDASPRARRTRRLRALPARCRSRS